MKKLAILFLAAGFALSSVSASAAELKISGQFGFSFGVSDGMIPGGKNHFEALQRIRPVFEYIADENLSGLVRLQIGMGNGGANWGSDGYFLGGSGDINVNLAYLDWIIPSTSSKVRMGFQFTAEAIPTYAFPYMYTDTRAPGISVFSSINENIDTYAAWFRCASDMTRAGAEMDWFAGHATFKYEGMKITPWISALLVGKNNFFPAVGYYQFKEQNAYLAGISTELTFFEPFVFALDALYSYSDYKNQPHNGSGWYAAASLGYTTPYGTPALKGWYGSGDSKSDLPGEGQARILGGGFAATSTMFGGNLSLVKTPDRKDPAGTWGVMAEWSNLSFLNKLSHTARIAYAQGTNNDVHPSHGVNYMTTKDSFVEVDLNSTYVIYKNLFSLLELAYVFNDIHGYNEGKNMWRSTLSFVYQF